MKRQIEEMQDKLSLIERHTENLLKTFSGTDMRDILLTMKSIAGNLSDAFDTLEAESTGIKDLVVANDGDIQRIHERTMVIIGDIRELREDQAKLEDKLDRLSDIILRNLKHIEVKGAEEDGVEG